MNGLEEVDVLVVGTGIMGMASAYHILNSNRKKRVLAIDRYPAPGQGNTGRSNAMFRNTFSSSDNRTLAGASIDFYLHVQQETKVDLGLQQIGYLWLMSEPGLSASAPFLSGMEKDNVETRTFGRAELKNMLPSMVAEPGHASPLQLPPVEGGVFGPKCGRLDPDKLVRFYAEGFTRMGGRMSMGTEAKKLILEPHAKLGVEGEPFVWQESRVAGVLAEGRLSGEIRARTVVLACGAWGNQLLSPAGIDGHVRSKKRQLFSVSAKGRADLLGLAKTKGFNSLGLLPLVILPKAGVHFKPVVEEDAFWVGCEDEVNRPFIDVPDTDLELYGAEHDFYARNILPVLSAYFPPFGSAEVKAMWAGLYSYNTVDYIPFAYRDGSLIVVGGDSGSGIMKGDSLGRVVDALYREADEAQLYGGAPYTVSKLGFTRRGVEREEWII